MYVTSSNNKPLPFFSVDKLLLHKSPSGTDASLRFAIHIRTGGYSQISIFQLFLINSQLVLRPYGNYTCPMVSALYILYTESIASLLGPFPVLKCSTLKFLGPFPFWEWGYGIYPTCTLSMMWMCKFFISWGHFYSYSTSSFCHEKYM